MDLGAFPPVVAEGPGAPPYSDSAIYMDTLVAIEVVSAPSDAELRARVRRALDWFAEVESRCSRFDSRSELVSLCNRPGEAVAVSQVLFGILETAVAVARASNGAFDPTVGEKLWMAGFDRNYRTGELAPHTSQDAVASFRDISLDVTRGTVTLKRPLSLDLGGIAKGFAIDLAAQELAPLRNFAINAGGDVFVSGLNGEGKPWRVGVRDPRDLGAIVRVLEVSDLAVCTSGGYERKRTRTPGHHILDPGSGNSPSAVVSATVIGPNAALADAFATAVFVLGSRRGTRFLERHGAHGLIGTDDGHWLTTRRFPGEAR